MLYKNILVPLDGSKRAEKILPHVKALAHQFGAKLVLVQVVEPVAAVVSPYETLPHYTAEYVDRLIDGAKAYLTGIRELLHAESIETISYVENGPIIFSLMQLAMRENVDLIALASHGRTGMAGAFYGSITAGLLNRIDRPLLVIRAEH
ncbi:MAG: universal stress protein [Caldilineaceae bacterium]